MSGTDKVQRTIEHRGGCHCGAVRFRFQAPEKLDVLDCNCSICAMTGYRHVIVPHVNFDLRSGGQDLIEYRFNTGTAVHLFCLTCGVKSFYQPRSHPDAWSVNFNCVTDAQEGKVFHFEGRDWEAAHGKMLAGEEHRREFETRLAKGTSYLDNFISCYLDPQHVYDGETDAFITEQLRVDVYREGLAREFDFAIKDPDFSWLDLFTRYWREPDTYGLKTEDEARDFAIETIRDRAEPGGEPPSSDV